MSELNFIENNRETFSGYHIRIARNWRLFGNAKSMHTPMVYSAFEFRMAIERYLFEFYYLLKIRKEFGNKEENKAISMKSMIQAIYMVTGGNVKLNKRLKFNRILANNQKLNGFYLRGKNLPSIFDINILHKYWSKLSGYCHQQLKPINTWESSNNDWVKKGYDFLDEVENYLLKITQENSMGWFNINDAESVIKTALLDFLSDKIDESTLDTRFQIMLPTLEKRRSKYWGFIEIG